MQSVLMLCIVVLRAVAPKNLIFANLQAMVNSIKLFFVCYFLARFSVLPFYFWLQNQKARVFVPDKPLQPSMMSQSSLMDHSKVTKKKVL